jgi:ribosomal protein S18 acetylase RimI-like enzyme
MGLLEVHVARSNVEDRVTATIVRAFMNDPAARWMYPNPAQYCEHFPKFVRAFGGRAFETGMVHRADEFRGAALWLPPRVRPDEDAITKLISCSVAERDQAVMFSVFERMGHYHPSTAHWHLSLLGVEPQEQGKGYGSALLHHALARCDAEGALAYLESSNEQNIPLYQRHGFEVLGRIQVGTSPPITPMLRQPVCS